MSRPPRVPGFPYTGPYRYFLTFCTRDRTRVFTSREAVGSALEQIRRTAAAERFAIIAYCFMPDHVHLLVEGTHGDSDLRRFAKLAKQRSGAAHAQATGERLWQEGYYEHVLRVEENTRGVARYLLENPVRAGLVASPCDYPFLGSELWSLTEILEYVMR